MVVGPTLTGDSDGRGRIRVVGDILRHPQEKYHISHLDQNHHGSIYGGVVVTCGTGVPVVAGTGGPVLGGDTGGGKGSVNGRYGGGRGWVKSGRQSKMGIM